MITTDGLRLYFYAITAHFGYWVAAGRRRRWVVTHALLFGQLHKRYRRRLVRIKYRMCSGTRRALRSRLRSLGWSGKLQTAFVERLNLTARMSVAALTRRTWAIAQSSAGLHRSLRQHGRARTPAMAAGLTMHRWSVREFLGYPCAQARLAFSVLVQLVGLLLDLGRLLLRSDQSKDVEILLLRRQLAILQRTQSRLPRLRRWEKLTLAVLAARLTRLCGGACPARRMPAALQARHGPPLAPRSGPVQVDVRAPAPCGPPADQPGGDGTDSPPGSR